MKQYRPAIVGVLATGFVVAAAAPAMGQARWQLAPTPAQDQSVAPFFEGWYTNPDGTYTISFGYLNFNTAEPIAIPLGENNFIEPAEFDGMQPTWFPVEPDSRERGVFTVTIPPEYRDTDIVWTLRSGGRTLSVPGRVTSPSYDLAILTAGEDGEVVFPPMAAGSVPPSVRFEGDGSVGRGPRGAWAPKTLSTRVGQPLGLEILAADDAGHRTEKVPLAINWYRHQGPGEVAFTPAQVEEAAEGKIGTSAVFSAAGEYIVRVRVDNFAAVDSSDGEQCCWTNSYFRISVAP
jgi:hypothetical protein